MKDQSMDDLSKLFKDTYEDTLKNMYNMATVFPRDYIAWDTLTKKQLFEHSRTSKSAMKYYIEKYSNLGKAVAKAKQ